MKLLISQSDLLLHKSRNKTVPCECYYCSEVFLVDKSRVNQSLKGAESVKFCSYRCSGKYHKGDSKSVLIDCSNCKTSFLKKEIEIKRTNNHFCSKSCAATYNNQNKTHGTRRSKLEIYLEEKLIAFYPNLEFHFNRKDRINSELDIFVPSLKLAFELNGIFHYEPIYGPEKLNQIQNNDTRKFQACLEQGIELCIIDTSSFVKFKEQKAEKYFTIISDIISTKLNT